MLRKLAIWLGLILAATGAQAQFDGEGTAEYLAAKDMFLSGADDLQAARMLASQAHQDNLAAQVLIGLIHRTPSTIPTAFYRLPREERWMLSRNGDSLRAKRWAVVAAARDPVAALIFEHKPHDRVAHAMALADLRRFRDAIGFVNLEHHINPQWDQLLTSSADPRLYPYTRLWLYPQLEEYAAFLRDFPAQEGKLISKEVVSDLLERLDEPTFADRMLQSQLGSYVPWDELPPHRIRMRGAALLHHPDLGQVGALMRGICPEDTAYHMGMLFYLQGNTDLMLDLLSELEPMITTEEWRASGRFRNDLLRKWVTVDHRAEALGFSENCLTRAIAAAQE